MLYSTSIRLLPIYQPHQRLLTVVDITGITALGNQAYGVLFQKQFTQHLIACGCDCNCFQKYPYISDPQKFASKHLARLSQDTEFILRVRLQYSIVIEDYGPLTVLPLQKLFFQRRSSHLHRDTKRLESGQHTLGLPPCWSNVGTRIWRRWDRMH